jgi:uncharacterized membrane protein
VDMLEDGRVVVYAERLPLRDRPLRFPAVVRRLSVGVAIAALVLGGSAVSARAATGLGITTPYPAVTVAPGSKVNFDLSVKTGDRRRVDLTMSGVPKGWSASLHGGGFVVDAVQTAGSAPATVRLDLAVPDDAQPATYRITIRAASGGQSDTLPLDISVTRGAGGSLSFKTDYPSLRGPTGTAFTFNLTLQNDTLQDATYTVAGQGPDGWQVQTKVAGQSQAASATVAAGGTSSVEVTVNPPDQVVAGPYPVQVTADVAGQKVEQPLQVEIIGDYKLSLTTQDGRLNTHGPSGSTTEMDLVVENSGTAPITGLKLSASPPSGWKVDFSPGQVDVAPAERKVVVARISPSSDALTGDYAISMTATGDQATASQDIRFTVETSTAWAVVGIGVIVITLIVLSGVFRRYGRR